MKTSINQYLKESKRLLSLSILIENKRFRYKEQNYSLQ